MAAVIGLQGLKTSDGYERLIAVYQNDFHVWNSSIDTWTGQGVPVSSSSNKWRSAVHLDKAYFVNGWTQTSPGVVSINDDTKRYNATNWRNEYASNHLPISKYIKQIGDRSYLGNLFLKAIGVYPSRVWFSDLPQNNNIKWGFEEGDITGTVGQKLMTVTASEKVYFKLRNIKIGDPIYLINADRQLYYIDEVINDFTIRLTENLEATYTNDTFWTGSNWVDVSPNDGDEITGLGDNNDNVLIFKRDSLYRYDRVSLRKIKGVPGTTSQESVVNIKDKTYYFHPTGVWECDGISSRLVSRPLQDHIDAVSSDMYPTIVAWPTGPSKEVLRVFVGNLTDTDNDISLTNAILDYDTTNETWSPGVLPFKVTCATEFKESNAKNVFLGTDDGKVYQDNKGTSDNGVAIPWMVDTGFHFPAGPQLEIRFEKFEVHSKQGRGAQVKYKLYGTPDKIDKQWRVGLGDIKDEVTTFKMTGRAELDNIGRGIALQFTESSDDKTPVIERVDVFWEPVTARDL